MRSDNALTEQPGRTQPAGSTVEPARSQRSERSDGTGDDERQRADGPIAITFTWSTTQPATKFLVGAKRRNQERGAIPGQQKRTRRGCPRRRGPVASAVGSPAGKKLYLWIILYAVK